MKKWSIALLVAIMVITLLTACSEESLSVTGQRERTTQEVVGSFYLFRTPHSQEYLTFLESFDETKYEIVDISTKCNYYAKGSNEIYMVTYKLLSETE